MTTPAIAAVGQRSRGPRAATLLVPSLLAWLAGNALYWAAADRQGFDYLLVRTHAAGTRATTSTSSATATPWPTASPDGAVRSPRPAELDCLALAAVFRGGSTSTPCSPCRWPSPPGTRPLGEPRPGRPDQRPFRLVTVIVVLAVAVTLLAGGAGRGCLHGPCVAGAAGRRRPPGPVRVHALLTASVLLCRLPAAVPAVLARVSALVAWRMAGLFYHYLLI